LSAASNGRPIGSAGSFSRTGAEKARTAAAKSAVGLAVATAAYAQIQSERVCDETDIVVEFVTDLLNS
jgi:hypothetical protein